MSILNPIKPRRQPIALPVLWNEYADNGMSTIRRAFVKQAMRFNINAMNATEGRGDWWNQVDRHRVSAPGKQFRQALRERDVDLATETIPSLSDVSRTRNASYFEGVVIAKFKGTDDAVERCACCGGLKSLSSMVVTFRSEALVCPMCVARHYALYSNYHNGWILGGANAREYYSSVAHFENSNPDWIDGGWYRSSGRGLGMVNGRNNTVFINSEVLHECQSSLIELYDYHSGPNMGHIKSAYDTRKPRVLMGLELEVELRDIERDDDDELPDDDSIDEMGREDIAKAVAKTLNKVTSGYCKVERDGSLDTGFEIITGYTGLDVHERTLKMLGSAKGFGRLRSHDTSTCGLHVHVDRTGMTHLHAAKLMKFIHCPENARLIKCIARRYNHGSYSAIHNDVDWIKSVGMKVRSYKQFNGAVKRTEVEAEHVVGARYEALNWNPSNTVEFRLFRGTTRYETVMACLEFAFLAWHFTFHAGIENVSEADFMTFICRPENRRDSRYLRAYLKAKNLKSFYQAEQVVRPKDKKIRAAEPASHHSANAGALLADPAPLAPVPDPYVDRFERARRFVRGLIAA